MFPFLASIITLDAQFITDMLAYTGTIWTDFKLLIVLVMGIPLAFWVVRKAMGLVRAR